MIQETLITTLNSAGQAHIAPMGVHVDGDHLIILPFKPSTTLENLLSSEVAVINYCDDVRIFAGCLTGRRDWPLSAAQTIAGVYLSDTLAHCELRLIEVIDDVLRPKLICQPVHRVNHRPFQGFNRAQYAVLELAILISRLHMLPWEKIQTELAYLTIGFEKTAGEREREAWQWLMAVIDQHQLSQEQIAS